MTLLLRVAKWRIGSGGRGQRGGYDRGGEAATGGGGQFGGREWPRIRRQSTRTPLTQHNFTCQAIDVRMYAPTCVRTYTNDRVVFINYASLKVTYIHLDRTLASILWFLLLYNYFLKLYEKHTQTNENDKRNKISKRRNIEHTCSISWKIRAFCVQVHGWD